MTKLIYKHIADLPTRLTDWVGSTSSVVTHTIFFAGAFALPFFGVDLNTVLLVLTTVVSLEAIYLAIFIQMTVNRNTQSLAEVEEDLDEIQEDVAGMEKDIDEIQEDVADIEKDIDVIHEEVVDDVPAQAPDALTQIHAQLIALSQEVARLREQQK